MAVIARLKNGSKFFIRNPIDDTPLDSRQVPGRVTRRFGGHFIMVAAKRPLAGRLYSSLRWVATGKPN
jgi:hypothetical protein